MEGGHSLMSGRLVLAKRDLTSFLSELELRFSHEFINEFLIEHRRPLQDLGMMFETYSL